MSAKALWSLVPAAAAAAAAAAAGYLAGGSVALAADGAIKVGDFAGSGLFFRDSIKVHAVVDPKIQGITLYISSIERPLIDRLKKEFFTEPSSSSIACCQTGPIKFTEPIAMSQTGEEIFSSRRNLFFKYMHVRRIYDAENNCLIYIGYSSRMSSDFESQHAQYRTSIAAIGLAGLDVTIPHV